MLIKAAKFWEKFIFFLWKNSKKTFFNTKTIKSKKRIKIILSSFVMLFKNVSWSRNCEFVSSKNRDRNGMINPIPISSNNVFKSVRTRIVKKIPDWPPGKIYKTLEI